VSEGVHLGEGTNTEVIIRAHPFAGRRIQPRRTLNPNRV
jgi:hypothetical protein